MESPNSRAGNRKQKNGVPVLTEASEKGEVQTFAVTGPGAGTYRTRIILLPGNYRFEGDIKVDDLTVAQTMIPVEERDFEWVGQLGPKGWWAAPIGRMSFTDFP